MRVLKLPICIADGKQIADGNDQKRKRMKSDSDISRLSPSMWSYIEACVSLKDEQASL